MYCTWKDNWNEAKIHYERWWRREGLVVANWGSGIPVERAVHDAADPGEPSSLEQQYIDPDWIARREQYTLARKVFPLDMLPIAFPDIGTVCLAPLLGATPEYAPSNIWYKPDPEFGPENDRDLRVDRHTVAWRRLIEATRRVKELAGARYFTGCPAICPNLDVLSEVRGTEALMMDLVLQPEWVHRKLEEIHRAFVETYQEIYDITREEDGSSAFAYFMIWAPGTVCLAQCDTAGMISREMFVEFVQPYLRKQCDFLDYTLYHVDGPMALQTVDPLLEIESLDAIEYTPGPTVPGGGDPHWFELYRKIKSAGKAVQVVEVLPSELEPLLDAIGPDGTYVHVDCFDEGEIESVAKIVDRYRV